MLGMTKKGNEKLNWLDKLDKINQLITLWSKRDLSIYGRVQIIKSFAVAQLVQVASLLPVPVGIVLKLNDIFFRFLWKGKDKVKCMKVIKPAKNGGINMVDIESMFMALKATWVGRIIAADPTKHGWAQLAHIFMTKVASLTDISGFSLDKETGFPALESIHPFHKEVVYGYSYANVIDLEMFEHVAFMINLYGEIDSLM